MKQTVTKILVLLLCLCMTLAVVGCHSKKDTSDASSAPTSDNTAVEENSSEPEAEETEPIEDTIEDLVEELPEEDTTYYEELSVLNAQAPITKEFLGINGVHMMFEYLTDDAGGRYLTEKQIQTHADRIDEMGIGIVRSLFSSSAAWDSKTQSFDWESKNFKGFLKSCKLMQDRGIDLAISPGLWSLEGILKGQDNDVETPNPTQLAGHGIAFRPCMNNKYELDQDALDETMRNYRKFTSDCVQQFKANGIHNIKYFMAFTEVNQALRNSFGKPNGEDNSNAFAIRHYDKLAPVFDAAITALDAGLKDAGMRNQYQIVAPCDTWAGDFELYDEAKYSYLVRYTLEHLADKVDIIGSHNGYCAGNDFSDDAFYDYNFMAYENLHNETTAAKKSLWIDEYNVKLNGSDADAPEQRRATQSNPVRGVALGSMVNGIMNLGVESMFLWQLDNQQWPNNSTGTEFDNGMQVGHGFLPSPLESMIPYTPWYSCSLLTKYIGKGQVYECTVGLGVYMSCIKRTDGNWTIVVTNQNVDEINAKIMLEKNVGGKTFYRHRYTPQVVPTPSATIIGVDAIAKNVTTGFYDTLPGFSVSVYTTVKD